MMNATLIPNKVQRSLFLQMSTILTSNIGWDVPFPADEYNPYIENRLRPLFTCRWIQLVLNKIGNSWRKKHLRRKKRSKMSLCTDDSVGIIHWLYNPINWLEDGVVNRFWRTNQWTERLINTIIYHSLPTGAKWTRRNILYIKQYLRLCLFLPAYHTCIKHNNFSYIKHYFLEWPLFRLVSQMKQVHHLLIQERERQHSSLMPPICYSRSFPVVQPLCRESISMLPGSG